MGSIIQDVTLTPLRTISAPGGDVLHAMKRTDAGFTGFGEAYFSTILHHGIKDWRRHLRMTMNLVVPLGSIRFVLYDDRTDSTTHGAWMQICLSRDKNYQRLTVPFGIWMAFQGLAAPSSMLLNIADLPHEPDEAERRPLDFFKFDWKS